MRWLGRKRDGRAFNDDARVFNPIVERFHYAQVEDLPPAEILTRYDTYRTCFLVDTAMLPTDMVMPVLAAVKAIKGKALVLGTDPVLAPPGFNVLAHGPQMAWANYTPVKQAA